MPGWPRLSAGGRRSRWPRPIALSRRSPCMSSARSGRIAPPSGRERRAGYVTYVSFGPKVLEAQGRSAIAAAGTLSVGSWLMILSGALCGQIVDRLGRRDLVLAVCMTGAVLSLWLLGVPGASLGASLLFGLVGMAPAGVIIALAGLALRPQVRAFGMGVFFTLYYAIMMTAPPSPVGSSTQRETYRRRSGSPWPSSRWWYRCL